ncbi:hypothetical protein N9Y32_06070 [Candidatus Thioglobus sp.]|nr:hypothetical protein [Candidatus Thioglobus sp.]
MKTSLLSLCLLPSLGWAVANIADGKLLYDESCAKCHHTPYQSLGWNEMTSKIEVSLMVSACSDHFQLDWNAQDIEDTTEFLNTEFFFFEK